MYNLTEFNQQDWGLADDHFEFFNSLINKINELEARIQTLETP